MPGRTTEADIEEAIREAEEELSPKREEQIDQSRGSTGKRNIMEIRYLKSIIGNHYFGAIVISYQP